MSSKCLRISGSKYFDPVTANYGINEIDNWFQWVSLMKQILEKLQI